MELKFKTIQLNYNSFKQQLSGKYKHNFEYIDNLSQPKEKIFVMQNMKLNCAIHDIVLEKSCLND